MSALIAGVVLWVVALWLMLRMRRDRPEALPIIMRGTVRQVGFVLPRMIVGVLGAGFYAALVPAEQAGAWLGPASGAAGALLAVGAGAVTPGGPIVAFAIAAALTEVAGTGQIIAYVTAWSLFSLNRTLVWELPLMGGAWIWTRFSASLPVLALIVAIGVLTA